MNQNAIRTLARTMWGEARGEYEVVGEKALCAIGWVVMNRLNYPYNFGKTIEEVCCAPYQFSCWNPSDPNYPLISQQRIKCGIYDLCQDLAHRIIRHEGEDPTYGADHYHSIFIRPPYWAGPDHQTCLIGHHKFYKLI